MNENQPKRKGKKIIFPIILGLVLVGMGTAIGLAMGFAIEHLLNSMLFNIGGVDIVAYVVVVPSLFLVTMLAAYVPARRASRIAPTSALRYE